LFPDADGQDPAMSTTIILDCDPGIDDALAIAFAAGSPAIELAGLTSVAGNVDVAKTTANALAVASFVGVGDVPVTAGCAAPLLRPALHAGDVHGESGLGGAVLPVPARQPEAGHAIDYILAAAAAAPGEITLVATGPLTNIGLALRREPRLASWVRDFVIMGGSASRGNVTPAAEFNIWADPEAADIVFGCGLPITMSGLNVTHQALATRDVLDRIAALGTPLATICVDLLTFFADSYRQVFGFEAPPLHDPVAMAWVIDPTLVSTVEANVTIELTGTYTRGATVVDLHKATGRPPNARVAVGLEAGRFWDLVVAAVDALG
jgi:purine nucleosidase